MTQSSPLAVDASFQFVDVRDLISDVDELKRRINSEWAALSHTVIECVVGECRQLSPRLDFEELTT